jgi:hypothetical protein
MIAVTPRRRRLRECRLRRAMLTPLFRARLGFVLTTTTEARRRRLARLRLGFLRRRERCKPAIILRNALFCAADRAIFRLFFLGFLVREIASSKSPSRHGEPVTLLRLRSAECKEARRRNRAAVGFFVNLPTRSLAIASARRRDE